MGLRDGRSLQPVGRRRRDRGTGDTGLLCSSHLTCIRQDRQDHEACLARSQRNVAPMVSRGRVCSLIALPTLALAILIKRSSAWFALLSAISAATATSFRVRATVAKTGPARGVCTRRNMRSLLPRGNHETLKGIACGYSIAFHTNSERAASATRPGNR